MTDINWQPVILSLKVAITATLLNFIPGTILAWLLSHKKFFGKNILDTLLMQPIILPPTVLGYYLLVALGGNSPLGVFLEESLGIELIFNWKGAVLAAMIASLPLYIKPVRAGFETVDSKLENTARLLGKSELEVFFHITLPLARNGILAGIALTFARSLGEFGTTLMIAGNIPGRTQTLSIAIYDAVQAGKTGEANMLVLLITIVSFIILYIVNKTVKQTYI